MPRDSHNSKVPPAWRTAYPSMTDEMWEVMNAEHEAMLDAEYNEREYRLERRHQRSLKT